MNKKLSVLLGHTLMVWVFRMSSFSLAGTFTVTTRDEMLQVISKIQASQFLAHATFGPTEAEIDVLAVRMREVGTLNAAAEWLNRQSNPAASGYPGKSLHEAKAEAYIAQDLALYRITDKNGVLITPPVPPVANGAANIFVMGGAVNTDGGPAGTNRIWGTYPEVKLGAQSPLDTSDRGTYVPLLSSDAYHAEICRWIGVPNDDLLRTILPNIRNFYGQAGSELPIGFLRLT
jgi:hypothetical protein